ncbi:MAG: RluA family pseudouridine synthase [Proteobacteria bacterium]|nr:RluA family pseudouridine synthase [Pseudomonadota bacterium]
MTAHTEYNLTASTEMIGQRVDVALASQLTNLSRSKIKALIQNGKLYVNDLQITDADYKIKAGDRLFLRYEQVRGPAPLTPSSMPLVIVYEDEHLLVLNKPAGLTVHPGAGNYQDTLANGLLHYLGHNISGPTSGRPGIIHRLDKDTSGLMIIAKQELAHMLLSALLARRQIKREYVAFVYGVPSPKVGTIATRIARSSQDRTKMAVYTNKGKSAVTHYKVEWVYHNTIAKVTCNLETGRTHQIRVHLTHKRHPIVGDQLYGRSYNHNLSALGEEAKQVVQALRRQALHAQRLQFAHPFTGEDMEFFAEPPADMQHLEGILGL